MIPTFHNKRLQDDYDKIIRRKHSDIHCSTTSFGRKKDKYCHWITIELHKYMGGDSYKYDYLDQRNEDSRLLQKLLKTRSKSYKVTYHKT